MSTRNDDIRYYNRYRAWAIFKIFAVVFAGSYAIGYLAFWMIIGLCWGSDLDGSGVYGWGALGVGVVVAIVAACVTVYNVQTLPPKHELEPESEIKEEMKRPSFAPKTEASVRELKEVIDKDFGFQMELEGYLRYYDHYEKFIIKAIPPEDELKGTIFYKYYKPFYQSKEGLSMLFLISRYRNNVPSPFSDQLIQEYNCMDIASEKILTKYPWLIGIPHEDGSVLKPIVWDKPAQSYHPSSRSYYGTSRPGDVTL